MTELPAHQDFTTEQAREFVERVRASVEDIKEWIIRAVKGRAWIALGYTSWDEMCETEFDGAVIRLPREDRREAVASLREAGLSTRAIGSALGVDHKTVVNDVRAPGENSPVPESVTSLDGRQRPATQPPRPALAAAEREQRIGFYRVHPFLAAFPWVDDALFARIVDSIKVVGLLQPITLTHDRKTMVDGRIRYRACEAAGVEATFTALPERYTETDILDFIWTVNMVRKPLSPQERRAADAKITAFAG